MLDATHRFFVASRKLDHLVQARFLNEVVTILPLVTSELFEVRQELCDGPLFATAVSSTGPWYVSKQHAPRWFQVWQHRHSIRKLTAMIGGLDANHTNRRSPHVPIS